MGGCAIQTTPCMNRALPRAMQSERNALSQKRLWRHSRKLWKMAGSSDIVMWIGQHLIAQASKSCELCFEVRKRSGWLLRRWVWTKQRCLKIPKDWKTSTTLCRTWNVLPSRCYSFTSASVLFEVSWPWLLAQQHRISTHAEKEAAAAGKGDNDANNFSLNPEQVGSRRLELQEVSTDNVGDHCSTELYSPLVCL